MARRADRAVLSKLRRLLAVIHEFRNPLAHFAIWLRLFPIRETCRVRSRSISAAGTVQVRVRAIARRISAESGTPAAFALARQSADSSGVRRTATRIGRRLAIGLRRYGGKGGDAPARAIHRSAGLVGDRRGNVPRQPAVIPWVCWLTHLSGVRQARRRRVRDASSAAANTVAATGLPKRGQRWDGGQRCRAVHVSPEPERRLIPRAPASMDTDISSAVGWINLTTLLLRRFRLVGVVLPFTLRSPAACYSTDSIRNWFQSGLGM